MNDEVISLEKAECTKQNLAFSSVVFSLCAISLLVNAIICIKLSHSKLARIAAIGIRALCMTSIINVLLVLMGTCLAVLTCYLDNLIVCIVQGLLTRLGKTAAHLVIALFYMESLFRNRSRHSGVQTIKSLLVLFSIIWIVVTCISEVPLFPAITYTVYPSSFSCDILDRSVLATSDSLVYSLPGLLILGISIFLVCINPRPVRNRSSYVIGDIPQATQVRTLTPYVGKPGIFFALGLLLEWMVRMGAVVVPDSRMSSSLFGLSMVLMLTRYMLFPALLFTIINHHHNSITAPTAGVGIVRESCPTYEETTIVRRISVTVSSGGRQMEVSRVGAELDVAIDKVVKAGKDAAEMNIRRSSGGGFPGSSVAGFPGSSGRVL